MTFGILSLLFGRSILAYALMFVLLVSLLSPSTSLDSSKPNRFKMVQASFHEATSSEGRGEVAPVRFKVSVDIDDALPYINPDPDSLTFTPLCAETVANSEHCPASEGPQCPSDEVCSERMDILAHRNARLAFSWNKTMAEMQEGVGKDKGFGISLDKLGSYRETIPEFIRKMKAENPNYKVLDIGALGGDWSWNLVDAILDFKDAPENLPKNIKIFQGDITRPSGWSKVLDYVAEHGKFDLFVCTHTLEDLIDPQTVVENMPLVAKAGRVFVPSRFVEMSRAVAATASNALGFTEENGLIGKFRGFFHHFWVFTVVQGMVVGVQKSCVLEEDFYEKMGMTSDDDMRESFGEIGLWWDVEIKSWEELPLKLFNSGFDELQEFVGLPTSGFYSDHIAGLHAYRELFTQDDLQTLYGMIFSVEVLIKNGDDEGMKKLQIYDNSAVPGQVEAFCKVYPTVACDLLKERVEELLAPLPWKRVK